MNQREGVGALFRHAEHRLSALRGQRAEELHLNRPDLSDSETRTLLDAYGLSDFKDAHPMTLSGGQKQRLAIAVAELLDVPVIVLDEPTSGLDLRSMRMVSKRLKELA